VRTADIYWGAIPWLFLQVILVVILIAWPGAVTYWIEPPKTVAPGSQMEIPLPDLLPPPDFGPPPAK
jgi:hypothetical protein